MKKLYSSLCFVMAVVMMAMYPTTMWADDTPVPTQVTITATSNDARLGSVTGSGTYAYSATETVTLTATPEECCELVKWSDGVTAETRRVPLTGDLTLTAEFQQVEPFYNEIWYTTTDGKAITTSVLTGQMGLTGNTYDQANSRFVMTFSQDLTSIEYSAFKDCTTLQTFTIPSSVTAIGDLAFEGCAALQSITIPSGVQTIGGEAFANCSDVRSITIPEGVGTIGSQAFKNCAVIPSGLSNNSDITNQALAQGGLLICAAEQEDGLLIKDNSAVFCRKRATGVAFPDNVTSIGKEAFSGCSELRSLYIPINVTSIGEKAFSGCSSLATIIVDDGWSTNVTNSAGMFTGCISLVGQNYTTYSADHTDGSYARVDGGSSNPGYFTTQSFVNTNGIPTSVKYTIKAGKYGTIILPFDWTKPANWTVYSCAATTTVDGTTRVSLTEVQTPEMNKPYIVKTSAAENETVTFNGGNKNAPNSVTEGLLTGVLAKAGATIPSGSYVLATKKTGENAGIQAFYLTDGTVTCPQYKCYLTLPAAAGSAPTRVDFDTEENGTTAIEAVFADDNADGKATKRLENGHIVIRKGGHAFTTTGQLIY